MSSEVELLKRLIEERDRKQKRASYLELYARKTRSDAEEAWTQAITANDILHEATSVRIGYDSERGEWFGRASGGLTVHVDMPEDADLGLVMDRVSEKLEEIFDDFTEWSLSV